MDITKESVLFTLGLVASIGLLVIAIRKGIDFSDFSFIKFWNGKHNKTNGAYDLANSILFIILIILALYFDYI